MTYTLEPELPPTATPADYSRIHFDPSAVPAKRIVGLLACQRDPLLRSLTSRVVRAQPAAVVPVAQKGRQKKKTPSASASTSAAQTPADTPGASGTSTPTGRLWEVELEDTVVFPEGGGQPWDTGRMTVPDANGTAHTFPIEGCIRRKLDAVHLVRVPETSPVVGVFESLRDADGAANVTVEVEVDWDRRLDHMVTHTAQHLLSALLDARELPTLSWGMSPHPTTDAGYVELPRGLRWAEAAEIERECNDAIRAAKKVWIDVSAQDQGVAVTDDLRVSDSRPIPKDYTGGVIRHCVIDGIDRNACCGTQCPDLSIIGFMHILPPSTPFAATAPSSKVPTRLLFIAGPRAVGHLSLASRALSQVAQVVSVGRGDVVERVAKIEANRYETNEAAKSMKAELARLVGEAAATNPKGNKAVWIHRTERATHDNDFLSQAAQVAITANPDSGLAAVLCTSAPSAAQGPVGPALVLVQAKDDAQAKTLFAAVKAALADRGVKGGGARGRYMAKVEGKFGKAEVEAVQAAVDGINGQA